MTFLVEIKRILLLKNYVNKSMKTVAIIPIKQHSERVLGKNFRLVNGIPLYRYLLDKLSQCDFDEVYIDSDSPEIKKYAEQNGYTYIDRLPELSTKHANGNDLLNYHRTIIKADYYFQLFVTAPLLKVSTINSCIKELQEGIEYDSILTSKSIYTWFWFAGKPVNYDPKVLPRSQDALPVVVETTGLYGISRNSLINNKSRIGEKPLFHEVSDEESIDLDNEMDFDYLEYFMNRLNTKKSEE